VQKALTKQTTAKAVVNKAKAVDFTVPQGEEVTAAAVWEWVQAEADGQLNNVVVTPLDNCHLKDQKRTPFGYSGKPDGVRARYHDFHLFGLRPPHGKKGDRRLGEILAAMRKIDGHSKQTMLCTVALLNGGYSPSAGTWLQGPWIKRSVVKA